MTVAAGIGTTTEQTQTYCPQFLLFKSTAVPQKVTVTIDGVGITYDLAEKGIGSLRVMKGYKSAETMFVLPLCTGFVEAKTVTVSITNNTAAAFIVYGWSKRKAIEGVDLAYFQAVSTKVFANSGAQFNKFALFAAPDADPTTDNLIINYNSGFQETSFFEAQEIAHHLDSSDSATAAYNYTVNNFDMSVKSINYTPAADGVVFVVRYAPAKGVSTKVQ